MRTKLTAIKITYLSLFLLAFALLFISIFPGIFARGIEVANFVFMLTFMFASLLFVLVTFWHFMDNRHGEGTRVHCNRTAHENIMFSRYVREILIISAPFLGLTLQYLFNRIHQIHLLSEANFWIMTGILGALLSLLVIIVIVSHILFKKAINEAIAQEEYSFFLLSYDETEVNYFFTVQTLIPYLDNKKTKAVVQTQQLQYSTSIFAKKQDIWNESTRSANPPYILFA